MIDSAVIYHRQALELARELPDSIESASELAKGYSSLGSSYYQAGRFTVAINILELSLQTLQDMLSPDDERIIIARRNLSQAYRESGDFRRAINLEQKNVEDALSQYGEKHMHLLESYNNIGTALLDMFDYKGALKYFMMATEAAPDFYKESWRFGNLYTNIGTAYLSVGNYDRAENAYRYAASLWENTLPSGHPSLGHAFANIGTVALRKGDYLAADSLYTKAAEVLKTKRSPHHVEMVEHYIKMADVKERLKKPEAARRILMAAFNNSADSLPDQSPVKIRLLLKLSSPAIWPNKLDSAMHFVSESLLLSDQTESQSRARFWQAHDHMAEITLAQGNIDDAFTLTSKVRDVMGVKRPVTWSDFPLATTYINWLPTGINRMNKLFGLTGDEQFFTTAKMFTEEGIKGSKFLKGRGVSPTQLAGLERAFHESSSMLSFRSYLIQKDVSNLTESYQSSDLCQSRVMGSILRTSELYGHFQISADLSEMEDSIRFERHRLGGLEGMIRRKELFNIDSAKQVLLTEQKALFSLESTWLDLLKQAHPNYFATRFASARPKVDTVRNYLILSKDRGILSYLVTDSATYTYLLLSDTLVAKRLPVTREMLRSTVQRFVDVGIKGFDGVSKRKVTRSASIRSLSEDGQNLYRILLQPIEQYLPQNITIIPDDVLSLLPFATLLTDPPKAEGRWASYPFALKKHIIDYGFSVTQQLRMKTAVSKGKGWYGFAPFTANVASPKQGVDNRGAVAGDPLVPLGLLVKSGPEVEKIAALMGGTKFTSNEANLETLIATASQANVLHLATHGVRNDNVPQDAYLAFYGDDVTNYFPLRAGEIYGLDLSAEMVVLSACESSVGRLLPGEGVQSLERAFAYAGAKTIVSSLWPANDVSTSELMIAFYENLQKGQSRTVALHEAMKSVYLSPTRGAQHPYYWAGWVLRGDNGPLQLD